MHTQSTASTLSRGARIMGFLANGVFMPAGFVYSLAMLALLYTVFFGSLDPSNPHQILDYFTGWIAVTTLSALLAIAVTLTTMLLEHMKESARSFREKAERIVDEDAEAEAFLASQPENNFWTALYRKHGITNTGDAVALVKKFREENTATK